MVEFNIEEFVESPSVEKLSDLRKVDWVSLAQHYEVNVRYTCKKEEIKVAVVSDLVSRMYCLRMPLIFFLLLLFPKILSKW